MQVRLENSRVLNTTRQGISVLYDSSKCCLNGRRYTDITQPCTYFQIACGVARSPYNSWASCFASVCGICCDTTHGRKVALLCYRGIQSLRNVFFTTYQIDGDVRVNLEPRIHANSFFRGRFVSDVIHWQLWHKRNISISKIPWYKRQKVDYR